MAGQKDDRHIVLGHTTQPVKTIQDIPTRRLLVEQYPGMDLAEQLPCWVVKNLANSSASWRAKFRL